MKKFLLSAALVGSLALGGCATTGPGGVPPTPTDQIAQAQQVAVALCGYLPVYQTVQDIIVAGAYPAGMPAAQLANIIGNAVCGAVMARSVRLRGAVPTVNGVPVRGSFVKRGASYNGVQIHGQWVMR